MARAYWGEARPVRRYARGVAIYAALLILLTLLEPISPALLGSVERVALFVGLLGGLALCARGYTHLPSDAPVISRWSRPSLLFGLGIGANTLGELVWLAYDAATHRPPPFPSWTDTCYLGAYVFLLLGILRLPGHAHARLVRARVLVDGLLMVTAVATCSWSFILGPIVLAGHATAGAAIVGVAYPTCDLVLICCLILTLQAGRRPHQGAMRLLTLAFSTIVVFDSVFTYQMLHGSYISGSLVNVGWTLGYMLVGLGAYALPATTGHEPGAGREMGADRVAGALYRPPLWRSLIPYTFLALVVGAVLALHLGHADPRLAPGIVAGVAALLGLLLLHQILTLRENERLYTRLTAAYAAQGLDLAQRVTDLESLRDIGRRLNAGRTLDEVLDIVYDGIRAGLGYDRVGIQVLDHERGVFEQRRGTDMHGRKTCPTERVQSLAPDSPLWRSPGVAAVLRGAEFHYMADALHETPPDQRELLDGAPTHNLTVPLRSGDVVTGAISVDNLLSGRPITPRDAGPLLALATQVGTAVENARLLERAHAERQAAESARLIAEEAVKVRDSFLIAASHDLRTPLTGIVGRSELIHRRLDRDADREAQDPWLREQVDALRQAGRRMVATVEEITDAAQLQMGRHLDLRLDTVDVGTLIRSAASIVEASLPKGSAPVILDLGRELAVCGDGMRLERVLQNVIGNAVKYSPARTPVHVRAQREGQAIVIRVHDRGVGIPADELPHIFTHFYRASTSIGIKGTGIGLSGSRTIVEQHGGSIAIDSAVGRETTVTIRLPLAEHGAQAEPADTPARGVGA